MMHLLILFVDFLSKINFKKDEAIIEKIIELVIKNYEPQYLIPTKNII